MNNPGPAADTIEYPGGVIAIDSGFVRPFMAACYLLEGENEVAVIETGTRASVDRIMATLAARGWAPEQVRHVIITHVHLDHAGGVGTLMQQLPAATLLVHPRGARHMIDPSRLEAGVRAVYGDAVFERDYGVLVPVAAERVREMDDGSRATVGGRELLFRDSPGHARHHFCVWDEATRGWFTGDTFGLSYRELDTAAGPFIFPTTTPVQFDPDAMHASLEMLLAARPRWMYLTHFGRVGEPRALAATLHEWIDTFVDLAEGHSASEYRADALRQGMLALLWDAALAHGYSGSDDQFRDVVWNDIVLNVQGLEVWLDSPPRP
ncbi:MBL fold metallo-hydrolase [Marinihelvus fidelis]|uniref:MBL fold metallo-hydrolase n=1 Tax=Marinihelvus fidelis TaxID=2613842 RepID=A0A5N0T944_9GAMM|nr:MBL fold metallo-hydrolase [Marinihelvus fidelis]KAA9131291.1 MBL fold metallo-hydrolase [Marinihelvus fidelis]